ncbi:hypothetical protein [Streptomyces sp. SAS_275]|uniref:hypothetical protein n=1 Tax=Streptomyces sp. SAS_275 TaxID=3412746 RepID=UPI00403CCF41
MLNAVPDDRSTRFGFLSDEIVRGIVRRVLAGALRRDANPYITELAGETAEHGSRRVLRRGRHLPRTVVTEAGPVVVRAPRVNDNRVDGDVRGPARFENGVPGRAREGSRVSEIPRPGSDSSSVGLQIDRVVVASLEQATVTVRSLRGPVRRGARFDRLRGSAQAIELTLTQAVVYGHRVAALDTGLTAFVTLRGGGVEHLKSGTLASGWQVIEGANPLP